MEMPQIDVAGYRTIDGGKRGRRGAMGGVMLDRDLILSQVRRARRRSRNQFVKESPQVLSDQKVILRAEVDVLERFADADRALVDSLELIPTAAHTSASLMNPAAIPK